MEILWREIGTQIVGFILAVWILRKFAWKPILSLLDERRHKISDSYRDIEEKKAEALAEKARYEEKLKNIDVEARAKIQEAIREGNEAAARIRDQAQEERRKRLERAEEEVASAIDSARETTRQRTVDLALKAAEKVLRETLDDERHRRLVTEYVEQVEKASS
jgi:F-type H+-transporting ATPase subunit b